MHPLFNKFKMRAEAVGAQVERVAGKQNALQFIAKALRQEGMGPEHEAVAVWAQSTMVAANDRQQLCGEIPGLRFGPTRAEAERAKVGISQMDWALADTGTLVQMADAVDKRLASTLPRTHIALVSTASILPDLASVLARIDTNTMAYVAFITGPSRTADIERVLTIGVHGPARLLIVAVDELEVTA
jgi:L-lactate dehydrogenase complex protein LldG